MSQHQKRTIRIRLSTSLSLLLWLQFPLVIFLHLLGSMALAGFMWKSFVSLPTTSFLVFLGLRYIYVYLALSTSNLLSHRHLFLKHIQTHHNLFLFTTFTIPPVPNYCFNQTQVSLSLNFTPHIYVIILILDRCNASSFSLYSDHVSLLCNIEFSNQAS